MAESRFPNLLDSTVARIERDIAMIKGLGYHCLLTDGSIQVAPLAPEDLAVSADETGPPTERQEDAWQEAFENLQTS